jgi:hypothetical protein
VVPGMAASADQPGKAPAGRRVCRCLLAGENYDCLSPRLLVWRSRSRAWDTAVVRVFVEGP